MNWGEFFNRLIAWGIPIGVVIFFLALLYTKLKEPVDVVIDWFKSLFSSAGDKIKGGATDAYTTIYRYN